MVTEAQLILTISDFYEVLSQVVRVNAATPFNENTIERPPEVAACYDDLAMALVTYVRLEPDVADAIKNIRRMLSCLDMAVQLHSRRQLPPQAAAQIQNAVLP